MEHVEAGAWAYTLGDAVEAYDGRLTRALRHILFLRPNIIVVVDDLAAPEDATYQWLLHAHQQMELDEDNLALTVSRNEARMRVQFLTPDTLAFSQRSGWAPPLTRSAPDQFHFTASTPAPSGTMRFITVLMPYRKGEADTLPIVRLMDAEGGAALAVGERLVLIKDPDAEAVHAAGTHSAESAAVIDIN